MRYFRQKCLSGLGFCVLIGWELAKELPETAVTCCVATQPPAAGTLLGIQGVKRAFTLFLSLSPSPVSSSAYSPHTASALCGAVLDYPPLLICLVALF